MVYPIGKVIYGGIIGIWLKKVNGLENIPLNCSFIACPNHASFYDDLLVSTTLIRKTNKRVHMYVNRKYFKNFFLRKFLEWASSIQVEVYDCPEKKEVNEKAFKIAQEYLKKGDPVGIYPEGHRSKDGKLQEAKLGAAHLALTAKVPIIPIGIIGSINVLPKGKTFPKIKKLVTLNIGKPINLEKYYDNQDNKKVLKEVTTLVMKEIGKLSNLEYIY